jgi:hypothetical protein
VIQRPVRVPHDAEPGLRPLRARGTRFARPPVNATPFPSSPVHLPVSLAVISHGCAKEPIDRSDETGSFDEDPEDTGTESEGEPSEESDDGMGTDSEAPTVRITLEGATVTPPLESAAELHLQVEADDASGVSVVEFYIDDQLISSDDEAPYEAA